MSSSNKTSEATTRRAVGERAAQPAVPITYEAYPLRTKDGFELTLFRSRPTVASLQTDRRPVLLLPGANSNRFTFGVVDGLTLPASLNATGRDVWLLDFRGSRSSRYVRTGKPVINLDRKLDYDLPSAIDVVLRETGADRVDLVGHSLGGVFAYCFCAGPGAERVGRLVTLAAPASFEKFFGLAAALMHHPTRWLAPLARHLPGIGIDRGPEVRNDLLSRIDKLRVQGMEHLDRIPEHDDDVG